jgi:hypothetical protein
VTAIGRTALGKIFSSTEYLAWAARAGNKLDAAKLKAEFGPPAVRRPTAGSKYAQGLQTLCRENPPISPPPDPIPVPPDPAGLAQVFLRDAVFVTGLSSFDGSKRGPAKAAGFSAVYVQLMHGLAGAAEANIDEIPVFVREGWTVGGWSTYGQGSDPEVDGRRAAEIVRSLNLACWKANGEAWAEGEHRWKTEAFLTGWRAGGSPCPLGWSILSSDTANFARDWAFGTGLSVPGADIDIQVYGATVPTYTVGAGLGMLAQVPVPKNRIAMTFDVNNEGVGPFADYRTWKGPRRIWTGDAARGSTFDALA